MLILSRKRNEQIVIGNGIVVTVIAIRGGNVRLGIEAPAEVSVHRQEVFQAIREGRLEGRAVSRSAAVQQPEEPSEEGPS